MENFKELIVKYLTWYKELTVKFLTWFGSLILIFLQPIHGALWFVVVLVLIDTITGIMKAGNKSVKNIQSKKAFGLIPKIVFYFSGVIVAHCLALKIDSEIPFVKLALTGIAWIEIKSIDENFEEVFGFSFLDKIMEAGKKISKYERK